MTEVLINTGLDHGADFVSGLPEGLKQSAGLEGKPAEKQVVLYGNRTYAEATPLVYDSPNPNSRFGIHPPREVYSSGFPNWYHRQVPESRITLTIDKDKLIT